MEIRDKHKVGVVLNTPPTTIKEVLSNAGYRFHLINSIIDNRLPKAEIQVSKRWVIGFTSITSLINNIDRCMRPPVLFEAASIVRHLELNQPIHWLDAEPMVNGIINFRELQTDLLISQSKRKFVNIGEIKFEKGKPTQVGNDSKISLLFNRFLSTLPVHVHEAVITAFVTSIFDSSAKSMNEFLLNNRFLTNENRKEWVELVQHLNEIKPYLKKLRKGKLKTVSDPEIKKDVSRLKFMYRYFGDRNPDRFTDPEDNVNILNSRAEAFA